MSSIIMFENWILPRGNKGRLSLRKSLLRIQTLVYRFLNCFNYSSTYFYSGSASKRNHFIMFTYLVLQFTYLLRVFVTDVGADQALPVILLFQVIFGVLSVSSQNSKPQLKA